MINEEKNHRYASFWNRLAAYVHDFLILSVLWSPLKFLIIFIDNHTINLISLTLLGVVWIFYNPVMVAFYGKTLGQDLIKLQVIDKEGKLLSFTRAFCRNIPFLPISTIKVFLVYMLWSGIDGTSRDNYSIYAARTYVNEQFSILGSVSSLPLMLLFFIVSLLTMFITTKKQALHDILGSSIVVDLCTTKASFWYKFFKSPAILILLLLSYFGPQTAYIIREGSKFKKYDFLDVVPTVYHPHKASTPLENLVLTVGSFSVPFKVQKSEKTEKIDVIVGKNGEELLIMHDNIKYLKEFSKKSELKNSKYNVSTIDYFFPTNKPKSESDLVYKTMKITRSDLSIFRSMDSLKKNMLLLALKNQITSCDAQKVFYLKSDDVDAIQFGEPGTDSCIEMLIYKNDRSIRVFITSGSFLVQEDLNLIAKSFVPSDEKKELDEYEENCGSLADKDFDLELDRDKTIYKNRLYSVGQYKYEAKWCKNKNSEYDIKIKAIEGLVGCPDLVSWKDACSLTSVEDIFEEQPVLVHPKERSQIIRVNKKSIFPIISVDCGAEQYIFACKDNIWYSAFYH